MDDIKPFGRRIYLQPDDQKSVLQTLDKKLLETGTVLAVGEDVERVKVGDKLVFTVWGLDAIKKDGKEYYFITESDEFILATLALP